MGSEDLFRKKKQKSVRDLKRRKARRNAYSKILIVCEGEKTEPQYFTEARDYHCLSTVDVDVKGECGSSPRSVVYYAKQLYREAKEARNPYDSVYCVFDMDTHSTYDEALKTISTAKPKNTFFAINSAPCFEYWLLLHFEYTTKPYTALAGNSSANQLIRDLKAHIPNYQKGEKLIFKTLLNNLDKAKENAEISLRDSETNNTKTPLTRVHKLIEVLENLKKPRN